MSSTSILAFIILSAAIGYTFAYSPYGEVSTIAAQKSTYQDSLDQLASVESRKAELQNQFAKMTESQKLQIDTILPDSFNFVKLVAQIDAVAAKYGLSIEQITAEESDPTIGDSVEAAMPANPYSSGVIGFSFTSSYEVFQQFMDDLEKSMRILDVKSLKVGKPEKGLYDFQVEFETHWLTN